VKPGEFLARMFWRVGPILLIVWAVRSGLIDYKKYIRIIKGEKTPVEMQIATVSDILIAGYQRDRNLPEAYRLPYWLTQRPEAKDLGRTPHLDPFGSPLRLTKIPDGFVLSSDGPDKKPNTSDDVSRKVEGLEKLALQAP